MIPTKKLSFKQYIKDKPIKWGIKIFLLCGSKTGFICNAEVYTGKRTDDNLIANLGVTENLIVSMVQYHTNQSFIFYTDRFYTSVQVVEYLLKHNGMGVIGTALTNRREFPKSVIRRKNEMQRGDCELVNNGNIELSCGRTKKPIYFITSVYIASCLETVKRYDAKEKEKVDVA